MITSTKLEDLSDELLMMIISYCDDIHSIIRTFLPLNQRFQRILLDSRLHLLTDYFRIMDREERMNFYSKFSFDDRCRENHEEIFEEFFQRLISIYFEEKFRQIEEKYRIDRKEFEEKRSKLTDREKRSNDDELTELFFELNSSPNKDIQMSKMKNLVREKGASLHCENYELCQWNMSKAINDYLLKFNVTRPSALRSMIDLFQNLFISNPSLVENRDYVGNGGKPTFYFLIHYLFRLNDFYSSIAPWTIVSVDRVKYQLMMNFLLFLLQCCRETTLRDQLWNDNSLHNCFYLITSLQFRTNEEKFFVYRCQFELFRIVCRTTQINVDDYGQDLILTGLRSLIQCHRIDLLRQIFFETTFIRLLVTDQRNDFLRKLMKIFTENREQRKLFQHIFRPESTSNWLIENDLIFILLKRKEVELIKILLKSCPTLIHRLDDQGNDPLLFLSRNVNGCRHRLVEFLLTNGADFRRVNHHQQDFFQTLQLSKNRKLLDKLIEHEIIQIDSSTKTIIFPVVRNKETPTD